MIRIVRWNPASKSTEAAAMEQLPAKAAELPEDSVVWIDLDDPTPAEEECVLKSFLPVHALTLEDVTKPRRSGSAHLPKVEEFPDYLFAIVNPLPLELHERPGKGEEDPSKKSIRIHKLPRPQLSAILTPTVLVTHHYAPMPCIMEGHGHLERHAGNVKRGPDYLFHLILDGIVDDYAPMVDRISARLDALETVMFRRPTPQVLAKLMRVKRDVTYLRKTLILEREVLARLIRGEFQLVDAREIAYYRNVYDHLVRYTDLIENAREMVSDLMQTHLSATSNRLNEIMKTLTMISTIGMICTLITGYYGMNFKDMPELEWAKGPYYAFGLMVLTVVGALAVYRWKKWL